MTSSNIYEQPPPPYSYQQPLQGRPSNNYIPYPQFVQEQPQQQSHGDPRWGTPVMGVPASPSAHPDNHHVATGQYTTHHHIHDDAQASRTQSVSGVSGQQFQGPYVQPAGAPGPATSGKGPMDQFLKQATEYGKKAEVVMNRIKGHLMTGNFTDTAWGRVTAGTQLLTKGGFDGVYKATFPMDVDEKLKKTYACFLSTSTGPVAGTLFISTAKFAFCSDRPLSCSPPGGQPQAFSYYKVIIPLNRVKDVTPSFNEKKPTEKYIQITTKDNFEFWFMGFVNYDKGLLNTKEAVASFNARQTGHYQQHSNQPWQQPHPANQFGQQSHPPTGQQSHPPPYPNAYGTGT